MTCGEYDFSVFRTSKSEKSIQIGDQISFMNIILSWMFEFAVLRGEIYHILSLLNEASK